MNPQNHPNSALCTKNDALLLSEIAISSGKIQGFYSPRNVHGKISLRLGKSQRILFLAIFKKSQGKIEKYQITRRHQKLKVVGGGDEQKDHNYVGKSGKCPKTFDMDCNFKH